MSAKLVDVVRFDDPGCPWCYSAERVRIALETRYGEQLRWRVVQVGLYESGDEMVAAGYTTAGLAESYRKLRDRYRMPFCTLERPRLIGTWTAARAVKAAEAQSAAAGAALLRRLRLAWFVEVRLVDEPVELVSLAARIPDLDASRFEADLFGEASAGALARDRTEAEMPDGVSRALGKVKTSDEGEARYTTPTYVFSTDGRSSSVPGFQPLEAYEVTLHNLAPWLERRPAPEAGEFLGARPGEPFATVEIAAAIARSERTASKQLESLAAAGEIVRTAATDGELWSAGPPALELECPGPPPLLPRLERELTA
jgi:predicted DsbA family dithiol-disulfide isomerase